MPWFPSTAGYNYYPVGQWQWQTNATADPYAASSAWWYDQGATGGTAIQPLTYAPETITVYNNIVCTTAGTDYAGYAYGALMNTVGPITETPAQRRERKRQSRLDDLAAKRAKALLLDYLDEQQRAEYEESRYFHVIGQGGRLYRIKHGSVGNVYRIGLDGNEEAKFCIHTRDALPAEDNMLAQMLLLKFDEEQFMATANRHW